MLKYLEINRYSSEIDSKAISNGTTKATEADPGRGKGQTDPSIAVSFCPNSISKVRRE